MSTLIQFKNNATGTIAGAIANTATTIALTAGHGARFPTLSGGQYFYATVRDATNNLEVIKVTGNSADTLTVVRGQEGTTALTCSASSAIELRTTAASLAALHDEALVDANTATLTHAATAKATPVDADELPLADSAASFVLKKFTWANIKSVLKTYFDALYNAGTNNQGYLNVPQNRISAAYTTVLTDAGKHIFHPAADATARVWTIDSNANVAYPLGSSIMFINQYGAGTLTIAITSDIMRIAGTGATGTRTLAPSGVATVVKVDTNEWVIAGTGLT